MKVTSSAYQDRKLSAWLICAGFLLSLFIFTGYSGKSVALYQQPVQTSWQYTNKRGIVIRNASYKKAAAALYKSNRNSNSSNYTSAVLLYNKLVQVKLIHTCNPFNVTEGKHLIVSRIIPGNSEEDSPVSIAG